MKRSLSLPLIVLYGLGTTIGAGIYALTGEVAGGAGMAAPLAFAIASGLAAFTAFSFAELASRHPRSAGEAAYVQAAFGWSRGSAVVGLLVVLAGTVSASVLVNGFAGYLAELVASPRAAAILLCAAALGGVAAWGISQSVLVASLITALEIGGLVAVMWVARAALGELPERLPEFAVAIDAAAWPGILAAAILAFYAFLGFEDMVNVAEEVRGARRTLPVAIVCVLVLTTLLYVVLSVACVLAVPPTELAESDAPMALVYARSTGSSATAISLIGTAAMVNGALIQVIMASRVLYGLADQGALPAALCRIHPRTRTPILATLTVTAAVMVLGVAFPLAPLAEATSVITLTVFALVNLALIRLKRREPAPPGVWRVPTWVPFLGLIASAGFLLIEAAHRLPL